MINRRRTSLRQRLRLLCARRPAAWLPRARRSVVAALCGVSLAVGLWYALPQGWRLAKANAYFALTNIEVTGLQRLHRATILRWAGVHDGGSIWDAAPSTVRMRLQGHPWIQRASVQREFPHLLTIHIRERHPVAIVRLGTLEYVDRGGHVLGPLGAQDSRDFPVITGLGGARDRHLVAVGVHRALQVLALCQRLHWFGGLSEVHFDQERGVTIFPLRTAVAVVLGWGDWRQKLARSARVFAAWEGQLGRLAVVDTTFRGMVVVRLYAQHHPTAVRTSKGDMRV